MGTDFDEEKCNQRRRIAATRDEVEAAPIRFLASETDGGLMVPEGFAEPRFAFGELPEDDKSALSRINRRLSKLGLGKLKEDDVYIHYAEAANTNFVPDRYLFLGESTLRNIAKQSESGIAFMNSHRTGGMSAPTELPFGRTFAGRYEEFGKGDEVYKRAIVGIYMVRGQHPNGVTGGPSTDDLHKGISAGTISDVSMGLVGGERVCDLCGIDLTSMDENGAYLCPHAPGTDREVSADQRKSQKKRGVKDGKASYTLVDSIPQEVSAVYKGAVPGAGFRKSLALAKSSEFITQFGPEVIEAFGDLMTPHQIKNFGRSNVQSEGKVMSKAIDILSAFRFWKAAGEPAEINLSDIASIESPPPAPPARSANLGSAIEAPASDDLSERQRLLDEREREINLTQFTLSAGAFTTPLVNESKATPFEADNLKAALVLAAFDDKANPVTHPFTGKPIKRVDLIKAANSQRVSSGILGDDTVGNEDTPEASVALKAGEKVLSNGSDSTDRATEERKTDMRLLSLTPLGREILASDYGDEGRAFLASLPK